MLEPRYDAVLFDLFDTLVLIGEEHEPYVKSLAKAHRCLAKNGLNVSFPEFKKTYLQVAETIEAETSVTLEEPHFSVYFERTVAELGAKIQEYWILEAVDVFSREFKRHVKVDPQAVEVLGMLHGNYKIGVISNLSFSECVWEILQVSELKRFIDITVVSGDVNLRKPHPQIFNLALKYLGVKPSRAMFVGDTLETDVVGSKNIGMTSIHIKRKSITNSKIKPDSTITELKQLLHRTDINCNRLSADAIIQRDDVNVTMPLL